MNYRWLMDFSCDAGLFWDVYICQTTQPFPYNQTNCDSQRRHWVTDQILESNSRCIYIQEELLSFFPILNPTKHVLDTHCGYQMIMDLVAILLIDTCHEYCKRKRILCFSGLTLYSKIWKALFWLSTKYFLLSLLFSRRENENELRMLIE